MQEILSFIAQRRSIGQDDQSIQGELLAAGWDPQLVTQSFQQSPPASHPFETVVPPAMPNDSFIPQQPVQGYIQPQPQPVQQPAYPPQQNYGNIPNPQQLPQLPAVPLHKKSKLPLIFGVIVCSIIIGFAAWFFLINESDSPSAPVTSGGLIDQATVTEITDRDAQRRADVSRLITEAVNFSALNNGRFPEANRDGWQTLIGNFRDFNDPLTEQEYEFTTATPEVGQIQYANRVICNDDRLAVGNERSIVIRVTLESGAIHCVDNT